MPRIGKPEYKKEAPDYPVYTAKDFFALEAELEKFAVDKELLKYRITNEKEIVHFVPSEGVQKWYISKGALANQEEWCIKDIPLYKELSNKLEQYYSWGRRREYAIKHQLEDYGDLTQQVQIVDDIPF
jgi:hypothetical protein